MSISPTPGHTRLAARATELSILNNGSCETFKAGVHGLALGLAGIMTLYNVAAWLRRRQPHLAVNALLYGLAVLWEHTHVAHHLAARPSARAALPPAGAAEEVASDYFLGETGHRSRNKKTRPAA